MIGDLICPTCEVFRQLLRLERTMHCTLPEAELNNKTQELGTFSVPRYLHKLEELVQRQEGRPLSVGTVLSSSHEARGDWHRRLHNLSNTPSTVTYCSIVC